QMRMEPALLFGIAQLGFERIVERGLQPFQLVSAILDADPNCSRLLDIRKGTGAAERDLKRLELLSNFVRDAANIGRLGMGYIAQKFEREVHLLRPDPVDLGSRHPQLID